MKPQVVDGAIFEEVISGRNDRAEAFGRLEQYAQLSEMAGRGELESTSEVEVLDSDVEMPEWAVPGSAIAVKALVGSGDGQVETLAAVDRSRRREREDGGERWSARSEAIRAAAEEMGYLVVRVMGRLTVVAPAAVTGKSADKAICFRLKRGQNHTHKGDPDKDRCKMGAGVKTLHVGNGACWLHGGNNLVHSATSARVRAGHWNTSPDTVRYDFLAALTGRVKGGGEVLEAHYAQYDIQQELMMLRALMDRYTTQELLDEDGLVMPAVDPDVVDQVFSWAEAIGRQVKRGHDIETSTALTKTHLLYLINALTQLGVEYVPEDRRVAYADDLLRLFGLNKAVVTSLVESGDISPTIEGEIISIKG